MSRFLLRRKSRHLPSWLILDVRQNQTHGTEYRPFSDLARSPGCHLDFGTSACHCPEIRLVRQYESDMDCDHCMHSSYRRCRILATFWRIRVLERHPRRKRGSAEKQTKQKLKTEPNKAMEPTPVSVTIPAAQEVAPLTSAAHL